MPPPNYHIILRQVFELEFPAGADGFALQQELGRIIREKILPRMEALFDRFADPDELIRIDKLELDIGRIPPGELESTVERAVLKQLEEQLEILVINRPPGVERHSARERYFEQWLFFLENGYRPQHAANISGETLQTAVLERLASETVAVERFRLLIQKQPVVIDRLARQYADSFLAHVLETLTTRSQRDLPDFLREMRQWRNNARIAPKAPGTPPATTLTFDEPLLSPHNFWQFAFRVVTGQPQTDWISEKLLAAFLLHRITASAGTQPLVLFWRSVNRFKKTTYPLLKALLQRHPELLETASLPPRQQDNDAPGQQPSGDKADARRTNDKQPFQAEASPQTLPASTSPSGLEQKQNPEPLEYPAQPQNAGGLESSTPVPPGPTETSEEPKDCSEEINVRTPAGPGAPPPPASEQPPLAGPVYGQELIPAHLPPAPVPPAKLYAVPIRTGDFWYVTNAGVVLLHPFLSPFFNKLGLVENRAFTDEAAQQKAVHLLHFLATGQTEAPEYELVLPRFLCGIPFDTPLERFVDLTAEERAEGENLLQAAIDHWNKLGNTSPDGLREGFLKRDGKLELRDTGWYLSVEQKTIDILLDFLPWNLSMIKLPWMPELLRVEWA